MIQIQTTTLIQQQLDDDTKHWQQKRCELIWDPTIFANATNSSGYYTFKIVGKPFRIHVSPSSWPHHDIEWMMNDCQQRASLRIVVIIWKRSDQLFCWIGMDPCTHRCGHHCNPIVWARSTRGPFNHSAVLDAYSFPSGVFVAFDAHLATDTCNNQQIFMQSLQHRVNSLEQIIKTYVCPQIIANNVHLNQLSDSARYCCIQSTTTTTN